MKVLVIQQRMGIGDMVIFLPYIHAISNKLKTKVSLLVKDNSRASDLLEKDYHIQEIITLSRDRKMHGHHDGFFGFFKLAFELRKKQFDEVFIFNSSLRYKLLAKFAGIKKIYQYPLFRKKDNLVASAKNFTESIIQETIPSEPILYPNGSEVEKIKKNLDLNYKRICIGLSASGPTKRWDIQNYLNLCKEITKTKKCKFYLAGGKNDIELINQFKKTKLWNDCFSFEMLSIKETLPYLKNCNLYIGNDTGWLHIANALNIKCVALFMDSPVLTYGNYSKNIHCIIPEGETMETTVHDTLGKDKISFEKVLTKSLSLLS